MTNPSLLAGSPETEREYLLNTALSSEAIHQFHPGEIWNDTSGNPINAHGGGLLFHEGVYYWYGEHKIEGPAGNTAMVGVHCYSSTDLHHWRDEGIVLPVSEDGEIAAGCILERPKVVFNERTGCFVMWFHLEWKGRGYDCARSGVATSDSPTGRFVFRKSFRPNAGQWPVNACACQRNAPMAGSREKIPSGDPNLAVLNSNVLSRDFQEGQMARDMTLFVDDDGKAYHIYSSEENSTLHISLLSDDYLEPSGKYARVFPGRWMEAPAMFKRGRKYYLIASGCTGWAPNAARGAVAENIFGPWLEFGNPCVGRNPRNAIGPEQTFGGQSTHVQKIHSKSDAYIAMFDIWNPENPIDGRYVWLPVVFTPNGRFEVPWLDAWGLNKFPTLS